MGLETTSAPISIKKFLGLRTKHTDLGIDIRESSGLQNVNITEHSVETRKGSTFKHAVAFKDKTDTTVKNITGLYETKLNSVTYQVGIGGDAFKQFSGSAWTDRTGAVTITDDDDIHWSFATFKDSGAANDIIIAANGSNPPIKWTGSGNAAALATPPGNFNYPVVHKNKLWVAVGDIVYFSAIRNGESWDTTYDLIRLETSGEVITGMYVYADRVIVFFESAIYAISGSDNRDLYVDKIVTGQGTKCGFSIKEVESRRYGNILVFLGKDGVLKGFNLTKNLIDIGDPIEPLFKTMSFSRHEQCVSENFKDLNQYWLAMTLSGNSTNNQVIIYDYKNDYFAGEDGAPLSSMLYHTGININAMAIWTDSSEEVLITANYSGFALEQNSGLLDEEANGVYGLWQTKKIDYGTPAKVKMLTDLSIVTTQRTSTNASINVTTDISAGSGDLSIAAFGSLWGTMVWGTDNWSSPNTKYTRVELNNNDPDVEGATFGRWFIYQINHNNSGEEMVTNELITGVTDLGYQSQYLES